MASDIENRALVLSPGKRAEEVCLSVPFSRTYDIQVHLLAIDVLECGQPGTLIP